MSLLIAGLLAGQPLTEISKAGGARAWGFVTVIGALTLAWPMLALSWGQQYVDSAFAGVAMGAVPLLVLPLVAIFSPNEGIGPRRVLGMLLGFAGIATIIGPSAILASLSGHGGSTFWGQVACLSAACGYAIGSLVIRRAPKMPPLALAGGALVTASCVTLPLALFMGPLPTTWDTVPTLALIYAALVPTALGSVIRMRVITTAGSLFMSLTSYVVPVWSVIFGIVLLNETLEPRLFWGLGLILGGIALAQSRQLQAAFRSGR